MLNASTVRSTSENNVPAASRNHLQRNSCDYDNRAAERTQEASASVVVKQRVHDLSYYQEQDELHPTVLPVGEPESLLMAPEVQLSSQVSVTSIERNSMHEVL